MKFEELKKLISEELGQMQQVDIEKLVAGEKQYGLDQQKIVDFVRTHPDPKDEQVHNFAEEVGVAPEELENMIYKLLSDIVSDKVEVPPPVDVTKEEEEKIVGGKGDKHPDSDFDPEQLRKGIKIETEHTNDPDVAKEIAKDHLTEDPKYYDKLVQANLEENEEVEKRAYQLGIEYAKKIPFEKVKNMKNSEEMYRDSIKMGSSPELFDIFKYGALSIWKEESKNLKEDNKEDFEKNLKLLYRDQLPKKVDKYLKKYKGETNKMDSKKLRETISKVIKEYCDSKKINLKEMFDFERDPGDVTKQEQISPEETQSADQEVVDELVLYIDNDEPLYTQRYLPIIKNLAIKKAKGIYDPDLAIKLFMYLADAGAQKYVKEMDPGNKRWFDTFPKPIRLMAAKELRDKFEQEVKDKAYDYDAMLPKKYKGKEISEEESAEVALSEVWNKKSQKVGGLLLEKMGIKSKIKEYQDESLEEVEKWIQKAVPEKNKGRFEDWCKRHDSEGVNQTCIDKARGEGGQASKMANFAANVSGKYDESLKESEISDEEIERMLKTQYISPEDEEEKKVEIGDQEQLAEITPPGKEDVVKGIKKSIAKGETPKTYTKDGETKKTNPWAIAWKQFNKEKK